MPAYVPTLRREIAPLYLGRQGRLPPVVAIAGYFDDSHEGDIYAVAGYLGRVDIWDERFTPDWWDVLNRMPRRLSEFKASDCRHGDGEFSGWSQDERDNLTEHLVNLIVDTGTYPDLFGLGV